MGIDHGRPSVAMPEKLLYRAAVVISLQEMSSKGMTEGMRIFVNNAAGIFTMNAYPLFLILSKLCY